jgi:hypothetical protein
MTVQELFESLLTRLPGPALCSIFEAVREVQGIIVNRLLLRRSEMLQADPDAALDYAIGISSAPLPADYYALTGRPFVVGQTPLTPLDRGNTANLQVPGTPRFYEVVGRSLKIYPAPDAPLAVQVPYFYRPAILADIAAELPFYGEFDSVFVEGCAGVLSRGLTVVAERGFVGVIQSQVDAVLEAKDLLAEQQMADAINGI